jgi:hypothetical protein
VGSNPTLSANHSARSPSSEQMLLGGNVTTPSGIAARVITPATTCRWSDGDMLAAMETLSLTAVCTSRLQALEGELGVSDSARLRASSSKAVSKLPAR